MSAVLNEEDISNMCVQTSSFNASVCAFCTRLQILFACAEDCRHVQSEVSRYACRHVRGQRRETAAVGGGLDAVHPAAKHCTGEKGTNGLVVSKDTKDTCARAFCPVTVESRNTIG